MLKYIALALLCHLYCRNGKAQWFTDSLDVLPDSLVDVKIQHLPYLGDLPCCENFKMFESADSCLATISKADSSVLNTIDFSSNMLICIEAWGDCHARFSYRAGYDSISKKLVLVETEHYGGCRGMRMQYFWILIPKPPEGYEFFMNTRYEDEIHNGW